MDTSNETLRLNKIGNFSRRFFDHAHRILRNQTIAWSRIIDILYRDTPRCILALSTYNISLVSILPF